MPPEPLVSVLIVNYNGRGHLPGCLAALRAQSYPRHLMEVIVADNASTDGSVAWLRSQHPWVRIVMVGSNSGFAHGNRAALRHAHGSLIALLNNDTVADPNWLTELVRTLQTAPADVGGVASKMVFLTDPRFINSAGLVLYRDGRGGDRGFRERDSGQYDQTVEVFGGCGGALLLRRELLDDIGFLDGRMFMYYEDLDLAWRARHRGWRFLYAPRAVVRHAHCGSSGEHSPFFCHHVERSRTLTAWKNAEPLLAVLTSVGLIARTARAFWRVLVGGQLGTPAHASAYLRAVFDTVPRLPAALLARWRIRWTRRRVPERALARWMQRPTIG